jgi:hypothetical protein
VREAQIQVDFLKKTCTQQRAYEGLQNLFSSLNIIRMIRLRKTIRTGHVARMGDINSYKIMVGKLEGKRSLGRPKTRQ